MEKMKKILSIVLAMVLILTITACGSKTPPAASEGGGETKQEQAAESEAAQPAAPSGKTVAMIMGSGSSGGTYFALGGAMASAMNKRLEGISLDSQASGASVENLNMIDIGEFDLGIAMNATADDAWNGRGAFADTGEIRSFRAIGVVYHEVYQIVANASTNAKSVTDLKGLKVAIGPTGSGTAGTSDLVFKAAGIDVNKDIQPQQDGFGDAAVKMQDGHIDASCAVLNVPASSIVEMTTSMDLAYISVSDEEIEKVRAEAPYYEKMVIPAGTYSNTEDFQTITCQAVLYCRADLDDDTVYNITKSFYESAEEIAAAHPAGNDISLEGGLAGITTAVHPGAARFYEEKGIAVDSSLLID
ncbi:TAXI family TRAP transporter solute-binding subunit [[Clostridium] symbiosum]|uniref:TAXI family TRAP transporter solute-binding subunit n=1 Tax=Clostridium symbiosum TaxID=1512 RepID=UPI001D065EB8|nr:TAXI family TRAP transporter solute-binding subunit [[Clostridium] symbiosum]MCB6609395.1 TAXI family TRAP transporter solute-binding subunit [[Clostridium] symbiosum]MCB6931876.1 TAXI family TRAP transporter solute-binding subunit [[Clostridium] symbiosum]